MAPIQSQVNAGDLHVHAYFKKTWVKLYLVFEDVEGKRRIASTDPRDYELESNPPATKQTVDGRVIYTLKDGLTLEKLNEDLLSESAKAKCVGNLKAFALVNIAHANISSAKYSEARSEVQAYAREFDRAATKNRDRAADLQSKRVAVSKRLVHEDLAAAEVRRLKRERKQALVELQKAKARQKLAIHIAKQYRDTIADADKVRRARLSVRGR